MLQNPEHKSTTILCHTVSISRSLCFVALIWVNQKHTHSDSSKSQQSGIANFLLRFFPISSAAASIFLLDTFGLVFFFINRFT